MTSKTKEPVRLRMRKTKTGTTSLYLDIYFRGRRSYEYLHLYLVPEVTRADKAANARTMRVAENVLAKRLSEFRHNQFGFDEGLPATPLFSYIDGIIEERKPKKGTMGLWAKFIKHINAYDGRKNLSLSDMDTAWCQGFRDYLANCPTIRKDSSRNIYMSKLKAVLNNAVRDGLVSRSPMAGLRPFTPEKSRRMYLTIDELRRLIATPAPSDRIRAPFLFSCLTGLRHSDVRALCWEEVYMQNGFTRIVFRQQKTGSLEYLDISWQAASLMGERSTGLVFKDMPCISMCCWYLDLWTKAAAINKHITFHCARHTFATMMLDLGTDLYTVSRLLGHTNITTTQIYAKILDKNKQAAMARIPSLLK